MVRNNSVGQLGLAAPALALPRFSDRLKKLLKTVITSETHTPWLATNKIKVILPTLLSPNQVLQSSQKRSFPKQKMDSMIPSQ